MLIAIKTWINPPFILKMPVPSQDHCRCFQIFRFHPDVVICYADNLRERITADDDFVRFRNIHETISMPTFWKHSYLLSKLLTIIPDTTRNYCILCNKLFEGIFIHVCCRCSYTVNLQQLLWDLVIAKWIAIVLRTIQIRWWHRLPNSTRPFIRRWLCWQWRLLAVHKLCRSMLWNVC